MKVIKTTSRNANPIAPKDLVSADNNNDDGLADWQNGEPDEVETEWQLLQTNNGVNPAVAELQGQADDAGDGSEVVTRRYEFYRYGAAANTIDGESGEAMCAEVNPQAGPADPQYLHGLDSSPDGTLVTDQRQSLLRPLRRPGHVGAQMAGFEALAPLGLIDHLQDGEKDVPYTPRTVVVGGSSPEPALWVSCRPARTLAAKACCPARPSAAAISPSRWTPPTSTTPRRARPMCCTLAVTSWRSTPCPSTRLAPAMVA